jgi:hypothetical protein
MLTCFLLVYFSWLGCGLSFTSWLAPGPACPPPPRLAPGLVLCFTWPPRCFAGCDFWCVAIAVEEQWCSWYMMQSCVVLALVQCWGCVCCFPWYSSPGRWLGVAGSCGAANTPIACSDWAACHQAWSHPLCVAVLCTAMSTVGLYQVILWTDATLG